VLARRRQAAESRALRRRPQAAPPRLGVGTKNKPCDPEYKQQQYEALLEFAV
jgi:hypothetical protein